MVIVSLSAVLLFATSQWELAHQSTFQYVEEPLDLIGLAVDAADGLVTSSVVRSHIESSANATVLIHYLANRV